MDRRLREYYLVNFNYIAYEMRLKTLKVCVPSLKRSQNKMGGIYKNYQHLFSCHRKDVESMEYELRKMVRRDGGCGWLRIYGERGI